MMLSITNAVLQTWIFAVISLTVFLASLQPLVSAKFFPVHVSQELKGFAILGIIFSHVGYFLFADHTFLFPFSILAGVSVDLFLLLSGFGLTQSALKSGISTWSFYKKRLLRLFVPFWIVLGSLIVLDIIFLKIFYPWQTIVQAFFGIFLSSHIYEDLNSPFWYFTLILFYYILFGLLFFKKKPWLSALLMYAISYFILRQNFSLIKDIAIFYKIHILAFPLGILAGWICFERSWLQIAMQKIKQPLWKPTLLRYMLIGIFFAVACYFSYNSGIGKNPITIQYISLLTAFSIIMVFLLKKVSFGIFYLFGLYAYEIYLFHWPLMYRYDIFYRFFPAWLALIFYLILFLVLGRALQKVSNRVLKKG